MSLEESEELAYLANQLYLVREEKKIIQTALSVIAICAMSFWADFATY